ncbi:glycine betaine ABC transporter substrate-binding protein [Sporosalibacterium faouarense]|uniref:taurine ABC transporter substrate-binding protein n=1 Tax=Sporosalibacterium faouarense TaxID=516123 RepID=UPI00192B86BA|nr:glycine betaine ABC transporter substrate-binding protein [Sporosalibacterium faouarense]
MKKIFKRMLSIILIGIVMLSFVACNGTSEKNNQSSENTSSIPKEINFGILRVPNDETIAISNGLFDKYFEDKGIKCNYIVFDSGSDANKALASGSIDFATMGNTNAIIALSMDLDVEMIWIHEVLGEIEALAVKNNGEINNMEDLVGEKVATPFASTSHYILLNALKDAGIEDRVQLLDMKTPEIVAAWERGDIKAAYTWQPSLGVLLKDGKMLISSKDMAEKGFITANVEVVRKEFAEKYPDIVSDFISCLTEAADIYRKDPQKAADIISEELEIPAEEALLQMQGSTWHTPGELLEEGFFGTKGSPGAFATIMKDTSDFLQDQKSIDNSPSQEEFNDYVNPIYIEKSLETGIN